MKSFLTPSRHTGAIEPLEARIAPAIIYIGAVGNGRENTKDTEYVEDPGAPFPQGPRPAGADLISFVDIVQATDAISTSIKNGAGTPLVDLNKYFYLHLHAGDTVMQFTNANSYRPLITVTGGDVIALFTDIDTVTGVTNEFDSNELTGMILSPNAKVQVNGAVNGDIITGLDTHGTKAFTDDSVDLTSLGTTKSTIGDLRVLGGSVIGSVLSAGSIKSLTVASDVGEIAAGSAVTGHTFDLLKVQATNTNGSPVFDQDNNPIFAAERFTANFSAPAKSVGASISKVTVGSVGDGITAGSGGLGAAGGSINQVLVTQDTDSFFIEAGAGGASNGIYKTGGAGGSVTNIKVLGVSDDTGNSAHGNLSQGIIIQGGAGGGSALGNVGGKGGLVKNVAVGYDVGGGLSATTLQDGVHVFGGAGGTGKLAGAGGAVTSTKVQVQVSNVTTAGGLLIPADSIEVGGGDGGSSSVAGGAYGKGGAVSALVLSNVSTIFSSQTLVHGGNAGQVGGVASLGAAGGSVSAISVLGYDTMISAGDGSTGTRGGDGGKITTVTIRSGDDIIPRGVSLSAGTGGAGTTKAGGIGGDVTGLTVAISDLQNFSINAAVADARGGNSAQAKGGRGGNVTNIKVNDAVYAELTGATGSGSATVNGGDGGSGAKGGGKGGSLALVNLSTDRVAFDVHAGRGGNATAAGAGGAGGNVSSVFLQNESLVPVVGGVQTINYGTAGSLVAGSGGDGVGVGGKGGAGGAIKAARLTNDGDETMRAGDGGNGAAGIGGSAAGKGGSVISSLVVSTFGSGELLAGNAGLAAAKAAAGGSIQGQAVKVVTDNINGVRAAGAITIRAGSGSHGGAGGDIVGVAFEGPILNATGANAAPAGNILVQAGSGSAEGRLSGRGGNVTGVTGSATSASAGETTILAGDGGSSPSAKVGVTGGSINDVTISGGGSADGIIVVEAGDAGASSAAVGARGGSVTNLSINNTVSGTILRSVASGNGGDGLSRGGAAGNINNIFIPDSDIGFKTGVSFGYATQGGIFAGVGGAGARPGLNGSVTNVTAGSISSIVAGARLDPVPKLAENVANISLNTTNDELLISANNIFTTSGNFILSFGGDSTPLLNGGSSNLQVAAALNQLPSIKAVGGVTVQYSAAGGYTITFKNRGNQDLISLVETVTSQVSESIPAGNQLLNAFEAAAGAIVVPTIESQPGQFGVGAFPINVGQNVVVATESEPGSDFSPEIQVISLQTLGNSPTAKFVLSFGSSTTPQLNANATAAQVATALNALPDIALAGGVSVSAGGSANAGASFTIKFLATGDQTDIIATTFTPAVEQIDLSAVTSSPGGKFILTYRGASTAPIDRTASAATIATALSSLPTVKSLSTANNAFVTVAQVVGSPGVFNITFSENGAQSLISGTAFVPEVQLINLPGGAAGDTFQVKLNDQTSTLLKIGATAEQVQAALNSLQRISAAGGVTVSAGSGGGYSVKFNVAGDQPALTAIILHQEQQILNLTGTTGASTDYVFNSVHALGLNEVIGGVSITAPVTDGDPLLLMKVPGDAFRITTTTPGTDSTKETQTINFGTVTGPNGVIANSALKEGDLFVLNYASSVSENENTEAIRFTTDSTALAALIDAALAKLDKLNPVVGTAKTDGAVVTSVNGTITVAFTANGDVAPLQVLSHTPTPHPGSYAIPTATPTPGTLTVPEVQVLDLTTVVARGGSFTLNFNGATTNVIVPANVDLKAAIKAALVALPTITDVGGVDVTETARGSDIFNVTFTNPGNVPLIQGTALVSETEQLTLTNLRADPTAEFVLTFNGATTPELPAGSSASVIQTALNNLPTVKAGGLAGVLVFETTPGVFRIDFAGIQTVGADLSNIVAVGGGTVTHEVQHLDLGSIGAYSSGLFQLTFGTESTPVLPANASAADVSTALNALASVKSIRTDGMGHVDVTKTANGEYNLVFNRFGDQQSLTGFGTVLADRFPISVVQTTSGTPASFTVTDQRSGAGMTAPVSEVTKGDANTLETQRIDLSTLSAEKVGDFTVTFGNVTTEVLTKVGAGTAPSAQQLQEALNSLPTVRALAPNNGGAVTVTSGATGVYDIQFNTPGDVGALTSQFRESETQLVSLGALQGTAGGEFTIQIGTQKTSVLATNATAQNVSDALNALDAVKQAGGVVVTQSGNDPYTIAFQGLGDAPTLVVAGGNTHSIQRVAIGALATQANGPFTLTFNGETTAPITAGATTTETAAHIQTALNALNTVKDSRTNATGAVTVAALDGTGFFNVAFNAVGDQPILQGHSLATTDRIVPVTTLASGSSTAAPVATTTNGTSTIKEVQQVNLAGVAVGGEFQVSFDSNSADALAGYVSPLLKVGATSTDTATTIQNALNALPSIQAGGGSVAVVADASGTSFSITFSNFGDKPLIGATTGAHETQSINVLSLDKFDIPVTTQTNGGSVQEVQLIDLTSVTSEFALGFLGADTVSLPVNATASDIQNALNAIPAVQQAGNVTVTQVAGSRSFTVQFGTNADQPLLTGAGDFADGLFHVQFGSDTTKSFRLGSLGGDPQNLVEIANALNALPSIKALRPHDQGTVSVSYSNGEYVVNFDTLGDQATLNSTGTIAVLPKLDVALQSDGSGASTLLLPVTETLVGRPIGPVVTVFTQGQSAVNELQTINLANEQAEPAGSQFTLTFRGDTIATALNSNATAQDIQNALLTLPSIQTLGTNPVTVTDNGGSSFNVQFNVPGDRPLLVAKDTDNNAVSIPVTELVKGNLAASETQILDLRTFPAGSVELRFGSETKVISIPSSASANVKAEIIEQALNNLAAVQASDGQNTGTVVVKPNGIGGTGDNTYSITFSSTLDQPLIGASNLVTSEIAAGSATDFEVQQIDVSAALGTPNSSFKLSFNGSSTAPLPVDATPDVIAAALNALPTIANAGQVTVTSGGIGIYQITFGSMADQAGLIVATAGIQEVQHIDTTALTQAGASQYTLSFQGQTTAPLDENATAAQVQAALAALPAVVAAGGVVVTAVPDGIGFDVAFGSFDNLAPLLAKVSVFEQQTLDLQKLGNANPGFIQLRAGTGVTPLLPSTASAEEISAALNALGTISGGVLVSETAPGLFQISFNETGAKPLVQGVFNPFGSTERIDSLAPAGVLEAALDSISVSDVNVAGAPGGIVAISFSEAGDQNEITGQAITREQQLVDIFAGGVFSLTLGGDTTAQLPANATADQIREALNALPSVQAAGGVQSVEIGMNSSFRVTFAGDGDQVLLNAPQTLPANEVVTLQQGSLTRPEVQIANYVPNGAFNQAAFARSHIVGAIVDFNEADSNRFHFIDSATQQVVTASSTTPFKLGDTPIDGIIMARVLNQSTLNFIPEAELTADGFYDNLNRI